MDRPMDLHFTDAQEAFRAEARPWLAAHAPAPRSLPSLDTADGFEAHRAGSGACPTTAGRWSPGPRSTAAGAWGSSSGWSSRRSTGGPGPLRVSQNGVFLLAPTMFEFGTDDQKARFLPAMAAAEEIWCQGWSEPDAGSDLAGISSRAVRADAEGRVAAHRSEDLGVPRGLRRVVFGLFRTDPDAERHRGLTYFLVDLATPGVTVRPIPQSMARPASPRSSSRTCSFPTPRCSAGSTRDGTSPWPPPAPSGA